MYDSCSCVQARRKLLVSQAHPPGFLAAGPFFIKRMWLTFIIARASCIPLNATQSLWLAVFEHQLCQSLAVISLPKIVSLHDGYAIVNYTNSSHFRLI